MPRPAHLSVFALLALTACRQDRAERSVAAKLSDSAGVSVARYDESAIATAPLRVVDSISLTRVTAASRDFDLQWVFNGALLPDGRIVAMSTIPPKILVFGKDGQLQRAIGRLGQGPGDLMAPDGMLLLTNDSIYVPDRGNGRINWFSPDSGFRGAQPTPSVGDGCAEPVGLLPDRRVVWRGNCLTQDSGRSPTPVRVSRIDRSGAQVIAQVPATQLVPLETRYRGQKRVRNHPLRFGPSSVVAVWGSTIAIGRNEPVYQIDQVTVDGRLVGSIRIDRPRRAVTQAMRDAWIADELQRTEGPAAERMVDVNESRRLAREAPFADSLPQYGPLFVSPDETLWVVDVIATADSRWSAIGFRHDGSIVARIESSVASFPLHIANDRVLVREVDADGVTTLAVYPIRPQPSSARPR